jgi:PadR family transcriptional regulator PadR
LENEAAMSEMRERQGPGERESWETEIRRGVMQLFVLTLIREKETYGYEIVQNIRRKTMGELVMEEGTLYPLLKRMEQNNWVTSRWERVGDKIRKYYSITPQGEGKLGEMVSFWNKLVSPLVNAIKSTIEIKNGTPNGRGVLGSSGGPTSFCENCGSSVPEEANYCPTCGRAIKHRGGKGGSP